MRAIVTLGPLNEASPASCVSSPFSLVKGASRSAEPTKFEALGVTTAGRPRHCRCGIAQRPLECLLWVMTYKTQGEHNWSALGSIATKTRCGKVD